MSTDADAKKNPINLAKYSSHAYPATQVMQNHVVLVSQIYIDIIFISISVSDKNMNMMH